MKSIISASALIERRRNSNLTNNDSFVLIFLPKLSVLLQDLLRSDVELQQPAMIVHLDDLDHFMDCLFRLHFTGFCNPHKKRWWISKRIRGRHLLWMVGSVSVWRSQKHTEESSRCNSRRGTKRARTN